MGWEMGEYGGRRRELAFTLLALTHNLPRSSSLPPSLPLHLPCRTLLQRFRSWPSPICVRRLSPRGSTDRLPQPRMVVGTSPSGSSPFISLLCFHQCRGLFSKLAGSAAAAK
ncbi:hypothetical protein ACLOJK_028164 [Asimina triloba]